MAAPEAKEADILAGLRERGVTRAVRIGRVVGRSEGKILLRKGSRSAGAGA